MKKPPFIHIHGHSKHSFKDGHCNFESIIQTAKENNQPGIAITDHGYMFNAMDFYLKAKKEGIKGILGCEVYMIPEGKSAGLSRSDEPDAKDDKNNTVNYFHLVLLAKDNEGLENLNRLCSLANNAFDDDRFYYRPRLKRVDLKKYAKGLICSSACIGGELSMLVTQNQYKYAKAVAKWYKEVFGDDFYIEIQDHTSIPKEKTSNELLIKLAHELDIELVLANDYHYAKRENYEDHKLLKCMSYREDFYNPVNYNKYFPSADFYIKNSDEMMEIAKLYGEDGIRAYNNTYEIFKKVNVEVDTSLHFPKADISGYESAYDKLKDLILELLPTKYPINTLSKEKKDDIYNRIEKELADIRLGNFEHYFLIVYDIVKYSKENGILIGCGRGSGAASIVANILNITDIDPLIFDLIWERFWNPGRCVFSYKDRVVNIIEHLGGNDYNVKYVDGDETFTIDRNDLEIKKSSPPDIDIDVPSDRRDEVFDFTKRHFGYHCVANCATFGTYNGRNLVRDGGKALQMEDEANQVLKLMPYKGSPTLSWCIENVPDLIELYNEDDNVQELIDRTLKIEGCCTNVSTHAGGVVITDGELYKYTPVFKGKNGLTTQYPYETLEAIGCLKIDLLGHKAEQIIDNACILIKERHGIDINPYQIPMSDKKTFQLFKDVRMQGIPQLQGDWVIPIIQDVMSRDIEELSIEDIIALVTMIRPGSLDSGQTDKYRDACKGIPVEPDVPELEDIVSAYQCCLLYQEQIMKIATDLGEFTLNKADELRKVCAKTKYAHLAEPLLADLEADMKHRGISKKSIKKILDIVKAFFAYSFNKAHAAGYGVTSWRMAYLKAHYFLELTTAQLNGCIGNQEETTKFLNEVIENGYEILLPDVNKSGIEWTCEGNGIRIPFGSIDGIGESCAYAIVEERDLKGQYKSFEDFVLRLPGKTVKKGAIENLILLSAFKETDGYKSNKFLWEQYEELIDKIRTGGKKLSGKALFGANASKELGLTYKDIKGEFDIKEMQEDEEYLLGFKVTMTEDEKRILIKRLKKRSDKLRGSSSDSGYTDKATKKVKKKKKVSVKPKEEVEDEVVSVEDEKETTSIKDSLKSKLNAKKNGSKLSTSKEQESKVEDNKVVEKSSKVIELGITKETNLLLLSKKLNKYKSDNGIPVCFVTRGEDGTAMNIYIDMNIKLNEKREEILKKIVESITIK